MKLIFAGKENFEALGKAQKWCRENGYSFGALQADAPSGLIYGNAEISKWRNLSPHERVRLDGIMNAPGRTYRTGPVTVAVNDRSER